MKRWQSGFTIVEVVLFLAITGLLTVGLLAGVSAALRQQQYHDAVQSFAGFIRDQYSRVIRIEAIATHVLLRVQQTTELGASRIALSLVAMSSQRIPRHVHLPPIRCTP